MAESVNQNLDMKVSQVSQTTAPFPVVGLGASAGGLQPLKVFFLTCQPGRLLSKGTPTRWRIADLTDTGRTAESPEIAISRNA
jgi:hypothetical protein